ncbi:MAG: hypothetical protein AMXMBFR75_06590, partial [Candidatus Hinthialibacteria bacterium]
LPPELISRSQPFSRNLNGTTVWCCLRPARLQPIRPKVKNQGNRSVPQTLRLSRSKREPKAVQVLLRSR